MVKVHHKRRLLDEILGLLFIDVVEDLDGHPPDVPFFRPVQSFVNAAKFSLADDLDLKRKNIKFTTKSKQMSSHLLL